MSNPMPDTLLTYRLTAVAAVSLLLAGCAAPPLATKTAAMTAGQPNAIEISADRFDMMWERAVAVLNDYHFEIARESRIEGVIETWPRAGSNLFEPWHQDSVGYTNRLESTLQSIRRKVTVTFRNTAPGSMTMIVHVDKEIEDVPGLAAGYEGGATFSEAAPLERDLDQVVGQTGASRWLPRGNDRLLEVELLKQIRFARLN
ncbi:MAG: hypothetical protein Fues2KO_20320 [Fuerstiella sp.]